MRAGELPDCCLKCKAGYLARNFIPYTSLWCPNNMCFQERYAWQLTLYSKSSRMHSEAARLCSLLHSSATGAVISAGAVVCVFSAGFAAAVGFKGGLPSLS